MTEPMAFPERGLLDHVVSLRQVAARVRTGQEAAATTSMDRGAYGRCCQFLVDYFEPGMRVTVGGLATSVTELTGLATRLDAIVAVFVQAEGAAADAVGATPTRLPL